LISFATAAVLLTSPVFGYASAPGINLVLESVLPVVVFHKPYKQNGLEGTIYYIPLATEELALTEI